MSFKFLLIFRHVGQIHQDGSSNILLNIDHKKAKDYDIDLQITITKVKPEPI